MASSNDPAALADRNAVVTGASGGIGLAITRRLLASGAWVAMVARGAARLASAARAVGGVAFAADVSDAASVDQLAQRLRDTTGADAPDIIVNAAGAFELAPLAETGRASFDRQIAVNLRGPFLLIRAFLPAMLQRGSGHILTIGSVAGRHALPSNGAYTASKFGVRGLHAVLDAELRGSGVRSTLLEPAATDTPLWDAVDRERHAGLPERESMLSAEAVAEAALFALTRPPDVAVRTIALERS